MRVIQNLRKPQSLAVILITAGLLTLGLAFWPHIAQAQSPIHPTFPILDDQGEHVLESGKPASTMQTCGQCHDTAFIADHSYHVSAGFDDRSPPGSTPSERPWDTGTGLYGRWNSIPYRFLSPADDTLIDLTTPAWIQTLGLRHVGGGPAANSSTGLMLTDPNLPSGTVDTTKVDPETGILNAWDWEASGAVEMNCFLCHQAEPNNEARIEALLAGQFGWSNTATLLGSGIVEKDGDLYTWNSDAFDSNGDLSTAYLTIQDPDNNNCGQCHGQVHDSLTAPVVSEGCNTDDWAARTTGQIISPQRISESGMNISDKDNLNRAWDVHAERLLECTDCHFALNNPIYAAGQGSEDLDHLEFDPRRLDIGAYLEQPLHDFARGQTAQGNFAPELIDSMRRCEACHNPNATHSWLPYTERHMDALNCESCHIPQMYSAAFEQVDWTVIQPDGRARTICRGVEGTGAIDDLINGYTPVLMQRSTADGDLKLAPYNLVSTWFWIYGDPPRPVRLQDLTTAWLNGDQYHPEILAAFDQDSDGSLSDSELVLDEPEKVSLIAARLAALGLANPRIDGEIQPFSINHNVVTGEWAVSDCEACHSEASRVTLPIKLAGDLPGGIMPAFVKDSNTTTDGALETDETGELYYRPLPENQGLYVLGHDNVSWIDWLGALAFLGTFGGAVVHGGMRVRAARRRPAAEEPEIRQVFMYTFYERLWHWLQTIAILILTFTGLIIHKPELFGALSFRGMVLVHNILAFILVANAGLALFYNLISGDFKRFIPQPHGFFNQAIEQVIYYTKGIFSGEEHPIEKTREKRLNPLQKITYFGILNVFLPLQILTGALMWGVQRWPDIANSLGGLPFLAPFHTLVAWLFASFIVAHVYLTTTGHTPLAGIKSMVIGWDEIETHGSHSEEAPPPGIGSELVEEGN